VIVNDATGGGTLDKATSFLWILEQAGVQFNRVSDPGKIALPVG
jgi:hypothetical protein